MAGSKLAYTLGSDALWSAMVTIGFSLLFGVPRKYLIGCIFAGVVAHVLRTLCLENGLSLELATLVGASSIGLLSALFGRRYQVPMSLFSMSAMISLVPGTYAYRTMMALLTLVGTSNPDVSLTTQVFVLGTHTALVVGAIAVGVVLPSLLVGDQQ